MGRISRLEFLPGLGGLSSHSATGLNKVDERRQNVGCNPVPLSSRAKARLLGTSIIGNIANTTQSSVMQKPEAAAKRRRRGGAAWPRIGIANIARYVRP